MSTDADRKIPQAISLASGIFAGATIGWRAGEAIGEQVMRAAQLVEAGQGIWSETGPHVGLIPAVEALGAVGGAVLGALIAREQPLETVMLAAVTLGSQFGHHEAGSGSGPAQSTADKLAPYEAQPHARPMDQVDDDAVESFHHLF